jgi:protein-tyrosine-phosphatase
MAESIARYDAADVIEPHSAGLIPLGFIADLTKQTLMKNGYSTDGLSSDPVTSKVWDSADIIINMTGQPMGESFANHEKVEDWIVQDPYGADPETYQRVFESIKRRVNQLATVLREERQRKKPAK